MPITPITTPTDVKSVRFVITVPGPHITGGPPPHIVATAYLCDGDTDYEPEHIRGDDLPEADHAAIISAATTAAAGITSAIFP